MVQPAAEDVMYVVHISFGCWRPPWEDVFILRRESIGQDKNKSEAMSIASRAIWPYEIEHEGFVMHYIRDRRLNPPDNGFLVRVENNKGDIVQVELTKTRTSSAVPIPVPQPSKEVVAPRPNAVAEADADANTDRVVHPNKKPRLDEDTPMPDLPNEP